MNSYRTALIFAFLLAGSTEQSAAQADAETQLIENCEALAPKPPEGTLSHTLGDTTIYLDANGDVVWSVEYGASKVISVYDRYDAGSSSGSNFQLVAQQQFELDERGNCFQSLQSGVTTYQTEPGELSLFSSIQKMRSFDPEGNMDFFRSFETHPEPYGDAGAYYLYSTLAAFDHNGTTDGQLVPDEVYWSTIGGERHYLVQYGEIIEESPPPPWDQDEDGILDVTEIDPSTYYE